VASRSEPTRDATFLFADIAGFTALTEAHGDEEAAELSARFCREIRQLLPRFSAQEVKTIGDAVMLRVAEPASAVRLGLTVAHDLMNEHGGPAIRVGMHTGRAVERDGDYFGSAVNLAARVSGVASGGEVLLTEATADGAGRLDDVRLEPRGRHLLRHVREPILLLAALTMGEPATGGLVTDPVCRMALDPARAPGRLAYGGSEHFFCSLWCAGEFAVHPDDYLRDEHGAAS
jgi:adenylate cyclase